uniref:Uncharacterized protein n=1 Tax=Cyprinus carpio TaxID=7962 RepID=A0A8C2AVW2_CYPCA
MAVFSAVFQTLPETAVSSYAASLKDKGSLVPALYKVIRENYSDVRRSLSLTLCLCFHKDIVCCFQL